MISHTILRYITCQWYNLSHSPPIPRLSTPLYLTIARKPLSSAAQMYISVLHKKGYVSFPMISAPISHNKVPNSWKTRDMLDWTGNLSIKLSKFAVKSQASGNFRSLLVLKLLQGTQKIE